MEEMKEALAQSKKFNRICMAMIVVLLIIMAFMLKDMHSWAKNYEDLESRYEELYEDFQGGMQE